MYALIGIRNDVYQEKIGEAFEDHRSEEIVALFHDRRDAKEYIAGAKLKAVKHESFSSVQRFRKATLLGPYEDAYIVGWSAPDYPIDPELK